jgi:hypothetical protein
MVVCWMMFWKLLVRGKGDPALYTGLLHLLSFPLRLAQVASGHLQALLSAKRDWLHGKVHIEAKVSMSISILRPWLGPQYASRSSFHWNLSLQREVPESASDGEETSACGVCFCRRTRLCIPYAASDVLSRSVIADSDASCLYLKCE